MNKTLVYLVMNDSNELIGLAKDRFAVTMLIATYMRCGPGWIKLGQNIAQVRHTDGRSPTHFYFRQEELTSDIPYVLLV